MSVTQYGSSNVLCLAPVMGLRARKMLALAGLAAGSGAGLAGASNGAKVINNHAREGLGAWIYGGLSALSAGVGAGWLAYQALSKGGGGG